MLVSVLLFFACLSCTTSISWLGIATRKPAKENWSSSNCSEGSVYGFTDEQVEVCRRGPDALPLIANSANAVLEECGNIFARGRWNCDALKSVPDVPRHLKTGTREQAAVYALSSAALGLAASRACGAGQSENCTCPIDADVPRYRTLQWRGTDDVWDGCRFNLEEGKRFAKSFIYPGITENKRGGSRGQMLKFLNKHNSRVGLQILEKSQKTMCRCMGPTGSCEMKICWKKLPSSLAPLAAAIKEKYDQAARISKKKIFGVNETSQANNTLPQRFRGELLYSTSYSYCNGNPGIGSKGIRGRRCDSPWTDSCDVLCCGRGYVTSTRRMYFNSPCRQDNSTANDNGCVFHDFTYHYCR